LKILRAEGVSKANILRESMNHDWKFESGWEGSNQKTILGKGMEISKICQMYGHPMPCSQIKWYLEG